jgi:hypothetical protein
LLGIAIAGCGSSSTSGPPAVHQLPGATGVDIPAQHCVTINAAPQTLPASFVSFELMDGGGTYVDGYRVAIVPSSYTCGADPLEESLPPYIDEAFTGSFNDSAQLPADDYSLDVICENTTADCLIASITWSAMY